MINLLQTLSVLVAFLLAFSVSVADDAQKGSIEQCSSSLVDRTILSSTRITLDVTNLKTLMTEGFVEGLIFYLSKPIRFYCNRSDDEIIVDASLDYKNEEVKFIWEIDTITPARCEVIQLSSGVAILSDFKNFQILFVPDQDNAIRLLVNSDSSIAGYPYGEVFASDIEVDLTFVENRQNQRSDVEITVAGERNIKRFEKSSSDRICPPKFNYQQMMNENLNNIK